jgi:hypothetical protein
MPKYFAIPLEKVPLSPGYLVWYAAWSETRPAVEPFMPSPLVIGLIDDESSLPASAILLAETNSTKNPPKPPVPIAGCIEEYKKTLTDWLRVGMG